MRSPASPTAGAARSRRWRLWLLVLGVALVALLVVANGAPAIFRELAQTRFRALAVAAAHLPSVICATLGWRVLLKREQRPGFSALFRLRLIKESVNALLPVAQVGGDIVRARLAASDRLPLARAVASCLVDIGIGIAALAFFAVLGLVAATATTHDAQLTRLGLRGVIAAGLVTAILIVAERTGLLRLADRATARARGAFGELVDLGEEVRSLTGDVPRMVRSGFWHLASWGCGVFETSVAMWAVGLTPTLETAFVLESMAQTIKAVGFAVPGALGVQEGGYLVLCAALGIPSHLALSLSLLRRFREIVLGVPGLIIWRAMLNGAAHPKR